MEKRKSDVDTAGMLKAYKGLKVVRDDVEQSLSTMAYLDPNAIDVSILQDHIDKALNLLRKLSFPN